MVKSVLLPGDMSLLASAAPASRHRNPCHPACMHGGCSTSVSHMHGGSTAYAGVCASCLRASKTLRTHALHAGCAGALWQERTKPHAAGGHGHPRSGHPSQETRGLTSARLLGRSSRAARSRTPPPRAPQGSPRTHAIQLPERRASRALPVRPHRRRSTGRRAALRWQSVRLGAGRLAAPARPPRRAARARRRAARRRRAALRTPARTATPAPRPPCAPRRRRRSRRTPCRAASARVCARSTPARHARGP